MFGVKIHLVDIMKLSLNSDTGNQVVIRPSGHHSTQRCLVCAKTGLGTSLGLGSGWVF